MGNVSLELISYGSLAGLYDRQGRLQQARRTYLEAIDLAERCEREQGWEPLTAGKIHAQSARLLLELDDLPAAQAAAERGMAMCRKWGHRRHELEGALNLALVHQARGDRQARQAALGDAEKIVAEAEQVGMKDSNGGGAGAGSQSATTSQIPGMKSLLEGTRFYLLMLDNDLEGVGKRILGRMKDEPLQGASQGGRRKKEDQGGRGAHLEQTTQDVHVGAHGVHPEGGTLPEISGVIRGPMDAIVVGRWLAESGRSQEALAVGERLERDVAGRQRPAFTLAALTLQARSLYDLGEVDRAGQLLRRALELAAPEGFLRVFWEAGLPADLVAGAQVPPDLEDFRWRLLVMLNEEVSPAAGRGGAPEKRVSSGDQDAAEKPEPLMGGRGEGFEMAARTGRRESPGGPPAQVEPLSERELEVLRLLAMGLSNEAIAARLYLSKNTLKAHTQNIYGKLDVHSRMEAVFKARQLGLIE